MVIIFLLVSYLASVTGAVCGIGGGVIIKPVLDAFGILDVSVISFLSGCTVLSMSIYSVAAAIIKKDCQADFKASSGLAAGAVIGGILGKILFQILVDGFVLDLVGAVQAFCLTLITIGTFIYTEKKEKIAARHIGNLFVILSAGCALGVLSSFLGIGGGPVNLVVLHYFFSMPAKKAAQNSLYIILFSQLASLINTSLSHTVPEFGREILIVMVLGGILGGVTGRKCNKKLTEEKVDYLFKAVMIIIIGINIFGFIKFLWLAL